MSNDHEHLTHAEWREQLRREELLALQAPTPGEEPPASLWKYHLHLGQDPDTSFQRILETITIIAGIPEANWPDEDRWRTILPSWFVQRTPTINRQQAEKLLAETRPDQWHLLPWDFGSWLDAIRVREWRWWGYRRRQDDLIIYLKLVGWPAHLDPFEYLLRIVGTEILLTS